MPHTVIAHDINDLPRRGMMLVLSSPSGAGKTSLSRAMLEQDRRTTLSISVTTRAMRPGEMDGRDYFFVDPAKFEQMQKENNLLESARVFDYHYGTPRDFVESKLSDGQDVLFDIDWQGTRQLAESNRQDLVSIFILPPSMAELERRLKNRAQDAEDVVARRMEKAAEEISHWTEYDYVLVNRDFGATLGRIKAILQAERCKRIRQPGLSDFIGKL